MPLVLQVLLIIVAIVLFIAYLVIDNMSDEMYDKIKEFLENKKGKEKIMKLTDLQKGNVFYTKKGNFFVVGKSDGDKTATNLLTGKTWDLYDSFENDDLVAVWDQLTCRIDSDPIWQRKNILADSEKAYLSSVIKPFKDRVAYIKKNESPSGKYHSIMIVVNSIQKNDNQAFISLPFFAADSMYKNMEVGVNYTVADLGL